MFWHVNKINDNKNNLGSQISTSSIVDLISHQQKIFSIRMEDHRVRSTFGRYILDKLHSLVWVKPEYLWRRFISSDWSTVYWYEVVLMTNFETLPFNSTIG